MRQLEIKSGQNGSQGLMNFDSLDSMFTFAERISKSSLTPLKEPADVVNAILIGRELGISEIQAIQNIYPINGRACIGVHILKGLLLKAGIIFEIIEDYVPQYAYIDSSKQLYTEENVKNNPDLFEIINAGTSPTTFTKGKNQVLRSLVPTDFKTVIKFKRYINTAKGLELHEITRSKLRSDYNHLSNKDNWKNAPKDMLLARVMGVGARDIAPDILGGIMLQDEMDGVTSPGQASTPTPATQDITAVIVEEKINNIPAIVNADIIIPSAVQNLDSKVQQEEIVTDLSSKENTNDANQASNN